MFVDHVARNLSVNAGRADEDQAANRSRECCENMRQTTRINLADALFPFSIKAYGE